MFKIDHKHSRVVRSSLPAISIAVLVLICVFLVVKFYQAAQLGNSALRFVTAEASSFVVAPELRSFMRDGSQSLISLLSASPINQDSPDFISTILDSPWLNGPIPHQCRRVETLQDVENLGINDEASLAVVKLDEGIRLAFKPKDLEKVTKTFQDILFPMYIRVSSVSSARDKIEESASTQNDETGEDVVAEKKSSAKRPSYEFKVSITGNAIELCDNNGRSIGASLGKTYEGGREAIYIPLRVTDGLENQVDVNCSVRIDLRREKQCKCEIVELGLGRDDAKDVRDCTAARKLNHRKTASGLISEKIKQGRLSVIGNHQIALVGSFLVIQSVKKDQRLINPIREYETSILRDDSFVRHFSEMIAEGKFFKTSLLAGARPDSILDFLGPGKKAFPLYLMTPVSFHFQAGEVNVRAVANFEPKDIAVIQSVTAKGQSRSKTQKWSAWRDQLGVTLADDSLKAYARFLRSYFSEADKALAEASLLGPIVIDAMEQGISSIVLSVADVSENGQTLALAMAIPDIGPDTASGIVSEIRRLAILRRAKFAVEKASDAALAAGVNPKDLSSAVAKFLCGSNYWKLTGIKSREFNGEIKILPELEIEEKQKLHDSWTDRSSGTQRVLPLFDLNAELWGDPYSRTGGFASGEVEKVKSQIEKFKEGVRKLSSEIANVEDRLQRRTFILDVGELLKIASNLSNARASIAVADLTSKLEKVAGAKNFHDASASITELSKTAAALKPGLNDENVRSYCSKSTLYHLPSPTARYEAEKRVLYIVEPTLSSNKLPDRSQDIDASGKLVLGTNAIKLASLMRTSAERRPADDNDRQLLRDVADFVEKFPFPKAQLSIVGRDTGAGVELRLLLKASETTK